VDGSFFYSYWKGLVEAEYSAFSGAIPPMEGFSTFFTPIAGLINGLEPIAGFPNVGFDAIELFLASSS
jgi:hypothetical protein